MQVAIIHDSLVEFGGAERVLTSLLELFPQSHVYTAYADRPTVKQFFPTVSQKRLHVTWAQGTPLVRFGSLFQCFSPLVWQSIDLRSYDLVISATSYLAANMVRVNKALHIQYIESLPKNLYDLDPAFPLQRLIPYAPIIRYLFQRALVGSEHILANSTFTQKTLSSACGIQARVIYPPVNIPSSAPIRRRGQYFLTVGRVDRSKSIEISIEACNCLRLPLKIVGRASDPQYYRHLHSLAGPTIDFLGFKSDNEIARLYQSAIGFLFSSKNEDFGIAPVEAMAHGVPVIAYRGGGAIDTVIAKKTGVFFHEHTSASLITTLKGFDRSIFSPVVLYNNARRFRKERFKSNMQQYIDKALSKSPSIYERVSNNRNP